MAGSQFAKGSRASIAYATETTWGTSPTATTLNINRITLTKANHGYVAEDYIKLIDGNTGAAWSGFYRIISADTNTFDVFLQCDAIFSATHTNIEVGNSGAPTPTLTSANAEAAASAYFSPLNGFTGESMKLNRNTVESDTIQPDQTTRYFSYGTKNTSGGIDAELIFSDLDEIIESNMQSQWEPLTSLTQTAHGGAVGETVVMSGSDDSFSGTHTIIAVPNDNEFVIRHSKMPLATFGAGANQANIDGGGAADVTAQRSHGLLIRNGTTQKPLSVEVRLADISQNFLRSGMVASEISYSVAINTPTTASVSFMGKDESTNVQTQTEQNLSTDLIKTVGSNPINTISGSVLEGGNTISDVLSVDLNVTQNAEMLETVFTDLSVAVNSNQYNFTGTLTMFLDDLVNYNKFVNGTESTLKFTLEEATSAVTQDPAYEFNMPSVFYTDSSAPAADQGTISHAMPFLAKKDATEGYVLQIIKIFSVA